MNWEQSGVGGVFPDTAWSMIAQLNQTDAQRKAGMEALCRSYWKPIYCFLRRAFRASRDDALDLAQAFFAWLVEDPVLTRYDPSKGSFRSFLRGLLRNFVRNHARGERTLKRGGGGRPLPLDALEGVDLPDPTATSPEEAFDQAWVDELIERSTERVRAQLRQEGKDKELSLFEAYEFPPPGTEPTYASVAKAHGVSANTVRHQLYKIRERVRTELRAELRDTVASPGQLEEEWCALFA